MTSSQGHEEMDSLVATADGALNKAAAIGPAIDLEVIIDTIADAVMVYGPDAQLIRTNAAFDTLFGYHLASGFADLPLAERWARLRVADMDGVELPLDARPEVRALRGEPLTGAQTVDLRITTLYGHEVEVGVSTAPLRNAQGAIIGAVAVCRDVTDRRRIEEAVRTSEARYRNALEVETVGVIYFDMDGRITDANDAFLAMGGYSRAELEAGHLTWQRLTPPEWIEASELAFAELKKTGRTTAYEKEYLRKNGTRWWALFAAKMLDDGIAIEFVIDLTAWKRAEDALRESESNFRTLADNMSQLAWMADPDGAIFWYNAQWYAYTGTTPQSQEGWGWQSVHDPAMLPLVLDQWKQSLATSEPFEMVFPIRGADGRFRSFLTRVAPVKDQQGRVERWFGTNTDIDQLKQLEAQLEVANQVKDEFLALAGHELRTPLTSLKALFQITQKRLRRGQPIDPKQLASQDRALERMDRLINDLLDATRVDTKMFELRRHSADLGSLCEEVAHEQRVISERGIQVDVPTEPVMVAMDSARMAQVVSNLLSNALKYSPTEAAVVLELRCEGAEAVLRVSDAGPGIAPEALPHLFERFYRAPGVTVRHGSGVGLGVGLYLARYLVERHEGSIGVTSEIGKGTTFTIRLPLIEPAHTNESASAQ